MLRPDTAVILRNMIAQTSLDFTYKCLYTYMLIYINTYLRAMQLLPVDQSATHDLFAHALT